MQEVFVLAGGQDDNLGDSVLRRALMCAMADGRRRMHVLTPQASDGYIDGLRASRTDVIHRGYDSWFAALRASPRPSMVFNAGEVDPAGRARYLGRRLLWEALRVRRRGGVVLHTGVGFRNPYARPGALPSFVLHTCNLVSWRDRASAEHAGLGAVFPDWAFYFGARPGEWKTKGQRETLAVTLRFDRPMPDASWVAAIRGFANAEGLRIVAYAQVARDEPRAFTLAEQLGAEFVPVVSTRHSLLEQQVRAIHRDARFVVSDRLHALIVGATEGAVPVGSAPVSAEKLKRTMEPAALHEWVGVHGQVGESLERASSQAGTLAARIGGARAELLKLRVMASSLLDGAR